jgi:hypothetical protein
MATITNNYNNKRKIVTLANQRLSEREFKITETHGEEKGNRRCNM